MSDSSPSRQELRKSSIKEYSKKQSIKHFLQTYDCEFSTPLDDLWVQYDTDMNGYLDEGEAKQFLEAVVGVIQKDRAANYDSAKFDDLFKEFDEDENGYLTKAEMAQFIKKAFKKAKNQKWTKFNLKIL